MSAKAAAALADRERLYTNLFTLERLQAFAEGSGAGPLTLPGLSQSAEKLLADDSMRGVAATWLKVFAPTIRLLQQFRVQDIHSAKPTTASDLREALEASNIALTAAVERFNYVAGHREAG